MLIATDTYESINADYKAALEWLDKLGVSIGSGRAQFYAKIIERWSQDYRSATENQGKEIFVDFVSSMAEVPDFLEIYRSLKYVPISELSAITEKLKKAVSGPVDSAEETEKTTVARNFLFEALVAARAHRPNNGIRAIFNSKSDTGIEIEGRKIWIECKRVTSVDKLEKNIRKACNQLEPNISRGISFRNFGLVAVDFTKILHKGGMLLVKPNDAVLLAAVSEITDSFIRENYKIWEKVYKEKHKKILGTLFRYSTMAVSEERNLLVRTADWAISPKAGAKLSERKLLEAVVKAIR